MLASSPTMSPAPRSASTTCLPLAALATTFTRPDQMTSTSPELSSWARTIRPAANVDCVASASRAARAAEGKDPQNPCPGSAGIPVAAYPRRPSPGADRLCGRVTDRTVQPVRLGHEEPGPRVE